VERKKAKEKARKVEKKKARPEEARKKEREEELKRAKATGSEEWGSEESGDDEEEAEEEEVIREKHKQSTSQDCASCIKKDIECKWLSMGSKKKKLCIMCHSSKVKCSVKGAPVMRPCDAYTLKIYISYLIPVYICFPHH
jgi:hypothetical protein